MQKNWSLYNRVDKLRIDDLLTDQVRVILLSIATHRVPDWYVMRDGDLHWRSLAEEPEFYDDVNAQKGESQSDEPEPDLKSRADKEKTERRPLFEENPELAMTRGLSVAQSKETAEERRSARRYTRQLSCFIRTGTSDFECETQDISMGGFSVDRDLPEVLASPCRVDLVFRGDRIKLTCRPTGARQMQIVKCESWDQLKLWVTAW